MLNNDCLYSTCQVCQMTKKERVRKKYWLLPSKTVEFHQWFKVCAYLVSSFTTKIPSKTLSLLALTRVHPATGWFKIFKVKNKSVTSIQNLFHNASLPRYTRLQFIVFDNRGVFKREFKQMCR
jgi:hypothetical protein